MNTPVVLKEKKSQNFFETIGYYKSTNKNISVTYYSGFLLPIFFLHPVTFRQSVWQHDWPVALVCCGEIFLGFRGLLLQLVLTIACWLHSTPNR